VFNLNDSNGKVGSVYYERFRECLISFQIFNYTIEDIKKEFLHEWFNKPPASTDSNYSLYLAVNELSNEVLFLAHLYAFWMKIDLFMLKGKQFSVIRKFSENSLASKTYSSTPILLGK